MTLALPCDRDITQSFLSLSHRDSLMAQFNWPVTNGLIILPYVMFCMAGMGGVNQMQ